MIKKTYKVEGMHCTSCALLIESDLEDAGIKASCNYAKQSLVVEVDEEIAGDDTVKNIVSKTGYTITNS